MRRVVLLSALLCVAAPAYAYGHGWRLRATDRFPGPPDGLWVHRLEAAPS